MAMKYQRTRHLAERKALKRNGREENIEMELEGNNGDEENNRDEVGRLLVTGIVIDKEGNYRDEAKRLWVIQRV